MLNLGLFELTLFGIIALVVLGPEKLPVAARTLGRWYGKIRRMSARLQHELVSELELLEVQNELKAEIAKIRESEAKIKAQMDALQKSLQHSQISAEQSVADMLNKDYANNTDQSGMVLTKPLTNRFFLLGDYDKKRRLPRAPFLPNYQADKLLYQLNR
ncbi:MAG: Sec-independent protein translocase protein TatB [Moraxella sp.]|nr:Sec-independent protein translocase protein TatB [Moraxella sp.]